jgi:hypothetical protein
MHSYDHHLGQHDEMSTDDAMVLAVGSVASCVEIDENGYDASVRGSHPMRTRSSPIDSRVAHHRRRSRLRVITE